MRLYETEEESLEHKCKKRGQQRKYRNMKKKDNTSK